MNWARQATLESRGARQDRARTKVVGPLLALVASEPDAIDDERLKMVSYADKLISHGYVHDITDVPLDFGVAAIVQGLVNRYMGRVPFPNEA